MAREASHDRQGTTPCKQQQVDSMWVLEDPHACRPPPAAPWVIQGPSRAASPLPYYRT